MKVLPVESSHFSPEITKKIPIFLNSKCEKNSTNNYNKKKETKQPLILLLPLLKKMILSVIIWKSMIFFSSFFLDEEKKQKISNVHNFLYVCVILCKRLWSFGMAVIINKASYL